MKGQSQLGFGVSIDRTDNWIALKNDRGEYLRSLPEQPGHELHTTKEPHYAHTWQLGRLDEVKSFVDRYSLDNFEITTV